MRTRDILQVVYGDGADGFQTKLADIASSLVAEADAREQRRMAAAELRDEMAHYGPLIDQVSQALTQVQAEHLTDSRLPAVLSFDAYCVMKDASKDDSNDRGLKQAAHALYDRWNQDPLGHLTVGELATYRDHFADMFPKSAARRVFDEAIPAVGFNTLTNLPYLTRIASEVVDQESYERAMEFHGLSGDRPEQIRARGYIKGVAELALSDEKYDRTPPTLQGAAERAVERVAQALNFGDEEEQDGDEDEMPEEATMAPGEEDEPHDEESEEMATINSPITGEPLVVELGVKSEDHPEGMEPGDDEESPPMAGPLPGSFEPKAQYQDQMPMPQQPPEMGMGGGEHGEGEMGAVEDNGAEMSGEETMTTIVDPTSGEELQLTLSPIEEEESAGEPEANSPGQGVLDELDEMGGGSPMEQESEHEFTASARTAKAPPGREKQVKELKKNPDVDNPFAVAQSSYDKSKDKKKKKKSQMEQTAERGFDEAMNTNVPTQQGPMTGDHSETDGQNFFSDGKSNGKSKSKKKDEKKAYAQKLTKEQVTSVCASFGLTPATIEEKILDGEELAAGQYAIRIGATDEIELRRLAYTDSTKDAKLIRTASLADFDGIVADFMALTAAQFSRPQEQPKPTKKAVKAPEKTASYVVTSDVPQGAPINARRMMASVWKLLPDADGELMDDGRLSVYIPSAQERDINRIARVLSDVFGVANIEAQKLSKSAQQLQPPLQQTLPNSPYHGQTPVARQPAGTPGQPMQAPMQQPLTGSGAQSDFIARHTDPMKQAEMDCAGCVAGEPHEMHERHAQMDEETPPEGDEAPPEDGDELANLPTGDPALDGGAPMGGPPMGGMGGPPMGGMPGMMPGMGMPGDPMGGLMGGGAPAPDASQMPIDIGMGQLMPEDDEAVRAAMAHFRNMGMTPLEAIDKFSNAYAGLFDKYGDKMSPQRSMAEAAVIRAMSEAWARPSVVPTKKAGEAGAKQAEMPHPRPPTQHPGSVTVKKDWQAGNVPSPAQVPVQQGPMQGVHSKSPNDIGQGDASSHSWGGDKKPGAPQKGSRHDQTGETWSDADPFQGTDGSGDDGLGKKMDGLSSSAPSTYNSTKTGALVIHFDAELGDFHLLKDDKRLSIRASLNEALADAERRVIGTDLRILIEDGQGGYEDALTGELVTL